MHEVAVWQMSDARRDGFLSAEAEFVNFLASFPIVDTECSIFVPENHVNRPCQSCCFIPDHPLRSIRLQMLVILLELSEHFEFWGVSNLLCLL